MTALSREQRIARLRKLYGSLMLQADCSGPAARKAECRELARRVRARMSDIELAGDADIEDGMHSQFAADTRFMRLHR